VRTHRRFSGKPKKFGTNKSSGRQQKVLPSLYTDRGNLKSKSPEIDDNSDYSTSAKKDKNKVKCKRGTMMICDLMQLKMMSPKGYLGK